MKTIIVSFLLVVSVPLLGQTWTYCHSDYFFTRLQDEPSADGLPLTLIEDDRGDGYPSYGYRFYRLLKVYLDRSPDELPEECSFQAWMMQTGEWCNPAYFTKPSCDTTLAHWERWVNRWVSARANGHEGCDVYRFPKVLVLNDSLWSIEVNHLVVPWEEEYEKKADAHFEYQRFLKADRESRPDEVPKGKPIHWVAGLDTDGNSVIDECEPCVQRAMMPDEPFQWEDEDGEISYWFPSHYEAFSFNPFDLEEDLLTKYGGESIRQDIYEAVLDWQQSNPMLARRVNEYQYDPLNNRQFMHCIIPEGVLVYLGEEGEMSGHWKLFVPFNE